MKKNIIRSIIAAAVMTIAYFVLQCAPVFASTVTSAYQLPGIKSGVSVRTVFFAVFFLLVIVIMIFNIISVRKKHTGKKHTYRNRGANWDWDDEMWRIQNQMFQDQINQQMLQDQMFQDQINQQMLQDQMNQQMFQDQMNQHMAQQQMFQDQMNQQMFQDHMDWSMHQDQMF